MKKVIVIVAMALMAFTAKAQVYVGGSVAFVGQGEAAVFAIAPEVGYSFDDNMAVGAALSVGFSDGVTAFALDPYFRYHFLEWGPVRFFADANFNFTNTSADSGSSSTWGIGIMPGIDIPVNDNWSLVCHVARVGYYGGAFGLNLNSGSSFGVYYAF